MIPFNKPPFTGNEKLYIMEAIQSSKISGDGTFSKRCEAWFERNLPCKRVLLTPSCTHALEMAAMLIRITPDDEVIMPSYTFVSTANAFALRGAKIVFVDIRPDTMNIDETKIEKAITSRTKAIVAVHYAGIACEMDTIMDIAKKHNLFVIEDAAQALMSQYKGKHLGTIGHLSTISFHETKNITSGGEGGLLIINDEQFIDRAEIIREKGTNRNQFFRGMVDKYTWTDIGSSYLMNDLSAAYLWGQLQQITEINTYRKKIWQIYYDGLKQLQDNDLLTLPILPNDCEHNGHMFYIKVKHLAQRAALIKDLNNLGIGAVFHYVPLHSSPAGINYGTFLGDDRFTTMESEKLLRLPLYYGITTDEISYIVQQINILINQ